MTRYNDEPYIRAEDLLSGGRYVTAVCEIEAVLEGAPLTRRLRPMEGLALKLKGVSVPYRVLETKVLGLGATNEGLCKAIFGDAKPATWVGKQITLEVRRVRGQRKGETQPAIRIMPPAGTEMRSGLIRELGEAYPKPSKQTTNANGTDAHGISESTLAGVAEGEA